MHEVGVNRNLVETLVAVVARMRNVVKGSFGNRGVDGHRTVTSHEPREEASHDDLAACAAPVSERPDRLAPQLCATEESGSGRSMFVTRADRAPHARDLSRVFAGRVREARVATFSSGKNGNPAELL